MDQDIRANRPVLHLMIHPGMAKTATSWLQSGVLPEVGRIVNLAKGSGAVGHGDQSFTSPEHRSLHYRVFTEVVGGQTADDRLAQASGHLDLYTGILAERCRSAILRSPSVTEFTAVLSDEEILIRGGFSLNAPLLNALIRGMDRELTPVADVRPHLVVTIREQKAWLRSWFSYFADGPQVRARTLSHLVDDILSESATGGHPGLHYFEELEALDDALPPGTSITAVPYEFLAVGSAQEFIRRVFHFLPAHSPALDDLVRTATGLQRVGINTAARPDSAIDLAQASDQPMVVLGPSRLRHVIDSVAHRVISTYQRADGARRLLRGPGQILAGLYRWFRRTPLAASRALPPSAAELSTAQSRRLDEEYANSNRRLGDLFGLPLDELGYPYPPRGPEEPSS